MNQPPSIPGSVPSKTSALAITGLVLGILAIVLCIVGPLFAIPAIICGHMAAGRIKRSGGALSGKGLAITGFILGYANLALMLVLLPIAIPNFVKARQTAQKNACIGNLLLIDSAKQQWVLENGTDAVAGPTEADIVPLLGRAEPGLPVCPAGGTYTIGSTNDLPTCTIPDHVMTP